MLAGMKSEQVAGFVSESMAGFIGIRIATRYDRCPMAFLSAIALAATVIFWL
jgi:hypothetical protein